VALIQNASLPTQRHAVSTLADLHATLVREELGSPCVIVVGDVLQGLLQLQQQETGPAFAWGT
jgi:uroporphyrin-III C-methyltransferase